MKTKTLERITQGLPLAMGLLGGGIVGLFDALDIPLTKHEITTLCIFPLLGGITYGLFIGLSKDLEGYEIFNGKIKLSGNYIRDFKKYTILSGSYTLMGYCAGYLSGKIWKCI